MIVERAQASAIHDFPGFINDVEAFRPCCIGVIGNVVHVVHCERQRKMESLDEVVGDGDSLCERVRLGVADVLIHVGLHLPFIERMSFADVDGEEVGTVLVIVIERDEVAYLAAEGRSGVTSENENQRALADPFAQVKRGLAVERKQTHVRRAVADMKIAVAPLRKRVTQETVHVARAAHQITEDAVTGAKKYDENERRPFPPFQGAPSFPRSAGRYPALRRPVNHNYYRVILLEQGRERDC